MYVRRERLTKSPILIFLFQNQPLPHPFPIIVLLLATVMEQGSWEHCTSGDGSEADSPGLAAVCPQPPRREGRGGGQVASHATYSDAFMLCLHLSVAERRSLLELSPDSVIPEQVELFDEIKLEVEMWKSCDVTHLLINSDKKVFVFLGNLPVPVGSDSTL